MSVLQRRFCRIFDRFLVKRDRPILKFLSNRIVSCRVSLVNPSILLLLESSCIYLIILLYEYEFKINIIIILDNSGTRVVAIGAAEDVSPNTLNL